MVTPEQGGGGLPPRQPRVSFAGQDRPYAFHPSRVLVVRAAWENLPAAVRAEVLSGLGARESGSESKGRRARKRQEPQAQRGPVVLEGVDDPVAAAAMLRAELGVVARVDHVFFAAPSATPVMFGGVSGAPVMFGGVGGAPVMFGGVGGAPVMFGGAGGAPVMFGGAEGVPVMFGGDDGMPTFLPCRCDGPVAPDPEDLPVPSTVQPLETVVAEHTPVPTACRVVVMDTGLAHERFRPAGLGVIPAVGMDDVPDVNADSALDSASGHATFIAGILRELAPDAEVRVQQVLSTFGDGTDSAIAEALWDLVADPPQVLNASFAGYSDDDTVPLAVREPLQLLLDAGVLVVAAAGNDATCRPAWPASHPGVISVGAVGRAGPAWFSNHGPHVRACAPGVDVVSRFFAVPDRPKRAEKSQVAALAAVGAHDGQSGEGVDGFARWSGTSFAAPVVAAVLARALGTGLSAQAAVHKVIDAPGLLRLHGLGTVVNERAW